MVTMMELSDDEGGRNAKREKMKGLQVVMYCVRQYNVL